MIQINLAEPKQLSKNNANPVSGFVSFPYIPDVVAALKAETLRKYDPKTKIWEIPYRRVSIVAEILSKSEDVEVTGEYIAVPDKPDVSALPEGFTFKTQPFAHQVDTLLFALQNDCFLLGDDQGLGKTKQIIDLFRMYKMMGRVKRCLVICCVNGNKYNWEEEVKIHSDCKAYILGSRYSKKGVRTIGSAQARLEDLYRIDEVDAEFIITNVETLRLLSSGRGRGLKYPIADKIAQMCREGEFGLVALDETHKNKNPDSQQSKAAMRIQDKYMIPMSGTFLLNAPFDLYWPLKITRLEDHSWYQFKQFYAEYAGYELVRYKNLDVLRETVEPVLLRRKKEEVLDLPDKMEVVEYVEMGKAQTEIYCAVRQDLLGKIDKIRQSNNPLSHLIRLRQATGWPGILSSQCEDSAKMDRMGDLVLDETAKGGKVIIFSNWTQITEVAKSKLRQYRPAYITGDTKQEERLALMKKFQDGRTNIIIGTIGAMGTGFTLNTATMVIFLDEPWNRGLKDQAADRAHRIGTKYPVTIVTIIAKGTIDERVNSIVMKKGAMSDFVIDGDVKKARNALNFLLDI